jgi:hypothetical protein
VKTIQQHAHRAISAVHTVRQQRRHRSTVARSATQNRGEDGEAPITDLRKKKVKQIRMESRSKKLTKTDCLCVFFWLQVTVIFTAGEERKRRRS